MPKFILIESSTKLCSVALAENDKILEYREHFQEHAALTAPMIKEVLDARNLRVQDCDAVCVSSGPGSYTGLRIGVTHAKGLCFGANLKLMAVDSLTTLAMQAIREGLVEDCDYIVPMLDARRMEVYTAIFDKNANICNNIDAKIVDENYIKDLEAYKGKFLFIGDGVNKCKDLLSSFDANFVNCYPKASSLLSPALKAFAEGNFEDLAYFEPFYLKDFVATKSNKNLFG